MSTDGQRATPRHELTIEVNFESKHNFYSGLSQDVGVGGIFVATFSQFPVGECVRVHFTLPGSEVPMDAIAEVRWVRKRDSPAGEAGMGLEFLQMSSQTAAVVKAFSEKREAMSYGG